MQKNHGAPYGSRTRLFRLKIGRVPRQFSRHSDSSFSVLTFVCQGVIRSVRMCDGLCRAQTAAHFAEPNANEGANPCQGGAF
jgi:hypothetical protein